MMDDDFTVEDLHAAMKFLEVAPTVSFDAETLPPVGLNMEGPFPPPVDPFPQGMVDIDWPVHGIADIEGLENDPLPYPVDVYAVSGKRESGLVGAVENGVFRRSVRQEAPLVAQHWDDDCACFVPHTVVWNGIASAPVVDDYGVRRRYADGALMGPWPVNPPRKEKQVNPVKARLAALEGK